MFDAINSTLGIFCDLLKANPDENSTTDVITDTAISATLATFNPSQLLGLAVKLLNFPAEAAHILYDLHVVLRSLVGNDIIRALGR